MSLRKILHSCSPTCFDCQKKVLTEVGWTSYLYVCLIIGYKNVTAHDREIAISTHFVILASWARSYRIMLTLLSFGCSIFVGSLYLCKKQAISPKRMGQTEEPICRIVATIPCFACKSKLFTMRERGLLSDKPVFQGPEGLRAPWPWRYCQSSMLCVPRSLSAPGGLCLGIGSCTFTFGT